MSFEEALSLSAIQTPALVIDRVRLERNIDRMAATLSRRQVRLRPHMKTTKCAQIARLAATGGSGPITVSTLQEAEYFFAEGFTQILYAVGIVPSKFERAAALLKAGADLILVLDDLGVAQALATAGSRLGVSFPVLIEVDCGEHRAGVTADSTLLLHIAAALSGEGSRLRGIMTHAGHSYDGRSPQAFVEVGVQETDAALLAAERLRSAGYSCDVVSVGSSPTAAFGGDLSGITEMRCGVYMFNDLFQAGIGACSVDDLALSVMASVIHHQPSRNRLLIDAGALALSKDRSTAKLPDEQDASYGGLMDAEGRHVLTGMRVAQVAQEHGTVEADFPIDFSRFPIGSRLRVLPNHACLTAAAYGHYYVQGLSGDIEAVWPRINGWYTPAVARV